MKLKKNEYTRSVLAKKTNCHIETIRFYEKESLMPEPKRMENGYRFYNTDDFKRLNFILRCKTLGFSIAEVKDILSLVDNNNYTCNDINKITKTHIKEIKDKINDLKIILKDLNSMSKNCALGNNPNCSIIETLFQNQ